MQYRRHMFQHIITGVIRYITRNMIDTIRINKTIIFRNTIPVQDLFINIHTNHPHHLINLQMLKRWYLLLNTLLLHLSPAPPLINLNLSVLDLGLGNLVVVHLQVLVVLALDLALATVNFYNILF